MFAKCFLKKGCSTGMEKCDILAGTTYIYIKFIRMFDKQTHKEAGDFVNYGYLNFELSVNANSVGLIMNPS